MSFVVAYHPFVSVTVEDVDTELPLGALRFNPTPGCARVIADHRMVFRPRETGFQISYGTDPVAAVLLPGVHFP